MGVIIDNLLSLVLDIFEFVFNLLFGWINLPIVPSSFKSSVSNFFSYIFNNLSILNFFIRIDTLKMIFKIFIIVYIFKYTLKLFLFIIHKIPDIVSKWTSLNPFQ